jgi:hypothetical protein
MSCREGFKLVLLLAGMSFSKQQCRTDLSFVHCFSFWVDIVQALGFQSTDGHFFHPLHTSSQFSLCQTSSLSPSASLSVDIELPLSFSVSLPSLSTATNPRRLFLHEETYAF